MSAERQSPSAAYVPTQINERAVIRSEERTSADLRSRSSGVSNGREPAAPARPTAVVAHSRKLMRTTLRTNRHGVSLRAQASTRPCPVRPFTAPSSATHQTGASDADEAISSRVQRHQLDRGGNRQLNCALYRI